ncbi:hypothetical protein B0H11DRAFT_2137990 [Mycena galericulata]|nr:hypothetical protein B0H11DRAFT_2137990 [Mycena galericulata]
MDSADEGRRRATYLLKTVRADTPTFAVLDLQARTRTSNCVCARAGREGEYKYELGLEFGGRRACSVLYQHSYFGVWAGGRAPLADLMRTLHARHAPPAG